MYDNYIDNTKFREIKSLIHDYTDYGEEYTGLSLEEISERAYEYFREGKLSSSQFDYASSLIEDLEG